VCVCVCDCVCVRARMHVSACVTDWLNTFYDLMFNLLVGSVKEEGVAGLHGGLYWKYCNRLVETECWSHL
jgi:hypothetical protein